MARDSYQEKLDTLRDDVLYMSEVVTDRLRMALEAMAQKDDDAAWEVIDGDDEINQLYLDLEDDCIDLLALQQPVAGDLRLIASSFKIITDLSASATWRRTSRSTRWTPTGTCSPRSTCGRSATEPSRW